MISLDVKGVKFVFGSEDYGFGGKKHEIYKCGYGEISQQVPHRCYSTGFYYKRISRHKYSIYKFLDEYYKAKSSKERVYLLDSQEDAKELIYSAINERNLEEVKTITTKMHGISRDRRKNKDNS